MRLLVQVICRYCGACYWVNLKRIKEPISPLSMWLLGANGVDISINDYHNLCGHLHISSNDLKISSNDLKISLIHLQISANGHQHLKISSNDFEICANDL